jgi:hypothetical protein
MARISYDAHRTAAKVPGEPPSAGAGINDKPGPETPPANFDGKLQIRPLASDGFTVRFRLLTCSRN